MSAVVDVAAGFLGMSKEEYEASLDPAVWELIYDWAPSRKVHHRAVRFAVMASGTAHDGGAISERRRWIVRDWLVRQYTPVWLRVAGLNREACALERLGPVCDLRTVKVARTPLRMARVRALTAREACSEITDEANTVAMAAAVAWDCVGDDDDKTGVVETAWEEAWDGGDAAWLALLTHVCRTVGQAPAKTAHKATVTVLRPTMRRLDEMGLLLLQRLLDVRTL